MELLLTMKQLKAVLVMFVLAATSVAFGTVEFNAMNKCDCGCEIMKKGDGTTTKVDKMEKTTKELGEGDEMVCLAR